MQNEQSENAEDHQSLGSFCSLHLHRDHQWFLCRLLLTSKRREIMLPRSSNTALKKEPQRISQKAVHYPIVVIGRQADARWLFFPVAKTSGVFAAPRAEIGDVMMPIIG